MKTKKALLLGNNKRIPAGTELMFNQFGIAQFEGEQIELSKLPIDACEFAMNEELHPQVFNQDMQMVPEVRERLLAIANDFYAGSDFKAPVQDIILTGSMANYNYGPKSDLDVHVVIDFKQENVDTELVKKAANAIKWQWNKTHNIVIAGHEVETYIQDSNEPHTASGVYSILNDKWLVVPQIQVINTSESDVMDKVQAIMMTTDELESRAQQPDANVDELVEDVQELRYKALRLRKDAFEQGENEFSVGNLAFKELRNNGTIERLLDLETALYDKAYSMSFADESLEKPSRAQHNKYKEEAKKAAASNDPNALQEFINLVGDDIKNLNNEYWAYLFKDCPNTAFKRKFLEATRA